MLGYFGACAKALLLIVPPALLFTCLVGREDGRWLRGRPMAAMLTLVTAGMLLPNVWLLYGVIVLLLPLVARSRSEAAAIFPIAILSTPPLSWYLSIGGAYILPVDKYLCAGLSLVIAVIVLPGERGRIGRALDLPFLCLLALQLVLARDGVNVTSVLRGLLDPLVGIALPYFACRTALRSPEDIRRLLLVTGFAASVLGAVATYEAHSGWLVYQTMYAKVHLDVPPLIFLKMRGGLLRAATCFGDSTAFALFEAGALLALCAIRPSFRSTRHWMVALGLVTLGMLAANSRNCFVGLAIGLVIFDLYRRAYRSLTVKIVAGALGGAVLLMIAQVSNYAQSLTGRTADTQAINDYRHQLLVRGLEEFHKHPWVGLSPTAVYASMSDMRQGEGIVDFVNAYLYYALTTGIAGPLLLLAGFTLPAAAMWTRRARLNEGRGELVRIGAYVAGATLSCVVTSALTGFGGRDSMPYYLTLAVGSALWALPRGAASAMHAAPVPPPQSASPVAIATGPVSAYGRFALPGGVTARPA